MLPDAVMERSPFLSPTALLDVAGCLSEVSSVVALAVTALRGPGWQEPILAWNPGLPAPNHWSLSSCLDVLRT